MFLAKEVTKGLQKRNIIQLLGKPLVAWIIEFSLKSKYVTKNTVESKVNK